MARKGDLRYVGLPEKKLDELAFLAAHPQAIAKIISSISEIGPIRDFHKRMERISEDAALDESDTSDLIHFLLRLVTLRDLLDVDSRTLIEILTENIEKQAGSTWKGKNLKNWRRASLTFVEALKIDGPLSISHKALRLVAAHQNVLRETQIITDIRPIFDSEGETILGSVVTHLMMIKFDDGADKKTVHLALDLSDVIEIRKLCERAEKKAKTISQLAGTLPGEVVIVGEEV